MVRRAGVSASWEHTQLHIEQGQADSARVGGCPGPSLLVPGYRYCPVNMTGPAAIAAGSFVTNGCWDSCKHFLNPLGHNRCRGFPPCPSLPSLPATTYPRDQQVHLPCALPPSGTRARHLRPHRPLARHAVRQVGAVVHRTCEAEGVAAAALRRGSVLRDQGVEREGQRQQAAGGHLQGEG